MAIIHNLDTVKGVYIGEMYDGEVTRNANNVITYRRAFIFCCRNAEGKDVEADLFTAQYILNAFVNANASIVFMRDGVYDTNEGLFSFGPVNEFMRDFALIGGHDVGQTHKMWLSSVKVTESDQTGIWFKGEATWEFDPQKLFKYDPPKWKHSFKPSTQKLYVPYNRESYVRQGDTVLPYRGIGYDGERYNGVDIAATEWKATCSYTMPYYPEQFTAYCAFLSFMRGCVNHAPWYGWGQGVILFEGADVERVVLKNTRDGSEFFGTSISMSFNFDMQRFNVSYDTNAQVKGVSTKKPILDANGNPVLDANGQPTYSYGTERPDLTNPDYGEVPPSPPSQEEEALPIRIPYIAGHVMVEPYYQTQADGSTRLRQVDLYQIRPAANFDLIGIPMEL